MNTNIINYFNFNYQLDEFQINGCRTIANNENLEIKLSHLTKTIFIFFLIKKEAIHVKELVQYEKMLLSIYKIF